MASGARVARLPGGAIGAIHAIDLADGAPALVLKVYPESLSWKMRKEVNLARCYRPISIPVPRILLADDSKSLVGLNYVLIEQARRRRLRTLEPC